MEESVMDRYYDEGGYDPETVEVVENEEDEHMETHVQQEEIVKFGNETNSEALQQLILMKSKVAIENKIKTDVTIDYLKYKLKYSRSKIIELDEKIKTVNGENLQLQNCVDIENQNFEQIERETANTKQLLDVITKQYEQDHIAEDELKNKSALLTISIDNLEEKYRNDLANHTKLLEKEKLLQDCVARQTELINVQEGNLSTNRQLFNALTDEISQDNVKLNIVSDELKNLEDYYSKKKIECNECLVSKNNCGESLNIMDNEINQLEIQQKDIKADFDKVMYDSQNEYQSAHARLQSFIETIDELHKKSQQMQNDITQIEQIISSIRMENAELSKQSTSLETDISNLTATKEQMHKQHLEKINACSNEIESIQNEIERTVSEINVLNKLKDYEMESGETLNKDISQQNELKDAYRSEQIQLNKQLNEIEQAYIELEDQHNMYEKLQSKLNSVNESINLITRNNASDADELLNKLNRLKSENRILSETTKSNYQLQIDAFNEKFLGCQRLLEKEKQSSVFEELQAKKKLREVLLVKIKSFPSGNQESGAAAPIGILKAPSSFTRPTTPTKNVSFKPTVSWNTISDSSGSAADEGVKTTTEDTMAGYKSMDEWFDSIRNSPPVRLAKSKNKNRFDA